MCRKLIGITLAKCISHIKAAGVDQDHAGWYIDTTAAATSTAASTSTGVNACNGNDDKSEKSD